MAEWYRKPPDPAWYGDAAAMSDPSMDATAAMGQAPMPWDSAVRAAQKVTGPLSGLQPTTGGPVDMLPNPVEAGLAQIPKNWKEAAIQGALLAAPVSLGLVLRGPNATQNATDIAKRAAIALEKLDADPNYWSKILDPKVKEAVAYIQAKYPKLSSNIYKWSGGEGPLGASYNKSYKQIDFTGPISESVYSVPVSSRVEDAGHELTHAVQDFRYRDLGEYVPARKDLGGGLTAYDPVQFEKYMAQPAEVQARQGGKTALNTYLDYKRLKGNK